MHTAGETLLCFKWSVEKQCVAKILHGIWDIFLHENNGNYYNFYKFSCKCIPARIIVPCLL